MERVRRSNVFTAKQYEENDSVFLGWSGYRHCLPDHHIGWRALKQYEVVCVVSGGGLLQYENSQIPLEAGDIFFLYPDVFHYYSTLPDNPWHLKWVAFDGYKCEALLNKLGVSPEKPVIKNCMNTSINAAADGILDNMYQERLLSALGYFYIMIDEIKRAISDQRARNNGEAINSHLIDRIMLYLSVNYNQKVNVETICALVNYSRSYISHQFKSETGMSIPQMLNSIRMQKANEMLSETNMSVEEVATAVGYRDHAYFIRLFQRQYGTTPFKYRKESLGAR